MMADETLPEPSIESESDQEGEFAVIEGAKFHTNKGYTLGLVM